METRRDLNRVVGIVACIVGLAAGAAHLSEIVAAAQFWSIPPSAMKEKSPVTPDAKVLKQGESIFMDNCSTCHGKTGKGDGPSGDPQHPPADLTDPKRIAANPDGIMFYKVWNGRKSPDMPAFKSRLTKEEVWTVVEYVKTLPHKAGA